MEQSPEVESRQRTSFRAVKQGVRAVLVALTLFGGLELLIARPGAFKSVLFTLVGFTFILLLSHGSRTWKSASDRHVMLLALAMTAASVGFMLFPQGVLIQHTTAVLLSASLGVLIYLLRQPVKRGASGIRYTPLEGFVLLATFLVLTNIAGLSLFFLHWNPAWNLALTIIGVTVASMLFGYQFFFFQGLPKKRLSVYLTLLGIAMAQVTWGLSYWPTDTFSRGVVLFVVFYLFAGLGKHALKKSFTWRIFTEYVGTSAVVLVAVLSTTQWTF